LYLALCSLEASCQRFSNTIFSNTLNPQQKIAVRETSVTRNASPIYADL